MKPHASTVEATTSNQEPPDTTAVLSIALNDNDNHRMVGSLSGVEGIDHEKFPEQLQDKEPAAPSPGEPTQKAEAKIYQTNVSAGIDPKQFPKRIKWKNQIKSNIQHQISNTCSKFL